VSEDEVARYMAQRGDNRTEVQEPQQLVVERFVLYVSDREGDVGSKAFRELIEPVREDFRVVDVGTIDGDLPGWLVGTPTLVDVRGNDRIAYKGTEAMEVVRSAYPSVLKTR